MKHLILTVMTVLLASSAFATSVRIPLVIGEDKQTETIAQLNAKLKAANAPLLPRYFEITDKDNGYEKVKALDAYIAKSLAALGSAYQYTSRLTGYVPADQDTAKETTCYIGNPAVAVNIFKSLSDSVYSDQFNVFGYKYRQQVSVEDGNEETLSFLNDGSKLWSNWKGNNDDLLILSSVGDDGDDINESLIKRCQ